MQIRCWGLRNNRFVISVSKASAYLSASYQYDTDRNKERRKEKFEAIEEHFTEGQGVLRCQLLRMAQRGTEEEER